ncbi:hypothetical protein GCM10027425_33680 [Alteromonas gracilis]
MIVPGVSLGAAVIAVLTTYKRESWLVRTGIVAVGLAILVTQVLLFAYGGASSSFEENTRIVGTVSE